MNAYKWVIFGLYAVSWLATISLIGKPRKPITPGLVVLTTITSGTILTLVYLA